jgi:hypothetical protein
MPTTTAALPTAACMAFLVKLFTTAFSLVLAWGHLGICGIVPSSAGLKHLVGSIR